MFEAYRLKKYLRAKAEMEKKISEQKKQLETTKVLREHREAVEERRRELRQLQEENQKETFFGRVKSYTSPRIREFEKKVVPALKTAFERAGKASTEISGMKKSPYGFGALGKQKKKGKEDFW